MVVYESSFCFWWRNRFFILSPRMSDGPLRPPWHIFAHTGHNQSRRKIILCSAPQGFWSNGRQLKHRVNCGLNQKSSISKTVYYIEKLMYKIRWINIFWFMLISYPSLKVQSWNCSLQPRNDHSNGKWASSFRSRLPVTWNT